MGGIEREEDEFHWYGGWIFLRYISENYGVDTIRSIWEYTPQFNNYDAVEAALADKGTSLNETFRGFSLALLTRAFEEGDRYPTVRLESKAISEATFTPNDGVGQMAADYLEIVAEGEITITLNADNLQGLLAGIKDQEVTTFDMPSNQATVDASSFDYLYLIVLNLNQAYREYRCVTSTYTVGIQPASTTADAQPLETLPAPNFQAPVFEPLEDPDEWREPGWEYKLPFKAPPELIPEYLPSGYELNEAYELTAEEIEQLYEVDSIWYVPGGGVAAVIRFVGPCGTGFSSHVSDSPYEALDGWYTETGSTPYDDQIITINGTEVVFVDFTDGVEPYFIFIYIHNGKFIVIEGTITMEEMTKVAESLIK